MGRVSSVGAAFGANVYTPLDLFRYTSTDNADPTGAGSPIRALTQQSGNDVVVMAALGWNPTAQGVTHAQAAATYALV